MKTLKAILKEVEEFPRSPDAARFVAWHRKNIKKTPDKNGNGDDVFKGTAAPRAAMKRHGYKSEEDSAKVNESFMRSAAVEPNYNSPIPNRFDLKRYNDHHEDALEAVKELVDLLKKHKGHVAERSKKESYFSGYHENDMKRIARDLGDYTDTVRNVVDSAAPLKKSSIKIGN